MLYSFFLWAACLVLAAFGAPSAVAAADIAVPHYEMTLKADEAGHRMTVEGNVTLPAKLARRQIDFSIGAAAGTIAWSSPISGVEIRAKRRGVDGNANASNPAERAGDTVWTLEGNWQVNAPVRIGFRYELKTPKAVGFLYIGPETTFGVKGWYPEIDGGRATSVIHVRGARGSIISSAGRALPATELDARSTMRTFTSTVPARLIFAISPADSQTLNPSPSLTLTSLKPRPTDAGWRLGFPSVVRALEEEFGALPYPHVTVIEVPDAIAIAAGFAAFAAPGTIFASSEFMDQPFNIAVFAHELSHLWWAHHVGLEGTRGDFLLDEGLAQYGAAAAIDRVMGAEAGARYRRLGYPGFNESLFSGLGYLKINAAGADRPLLALGDDSLSFLIAYSKAGHVWYALAETMGRDNFRKALREVIATHGAGSISWDAFVASLQRRSPQPLAPFLRAWFEAPGAPTYTLDWRQVRGSIEGQIVQTGAMRPAALELEIITHDGRKTSHTVRVGGPSTSFRIPVRGVRAVALDPLYKVLRWTPKLRAEAEAMSDYTRAAILNRLGKKKEAEAVLVADLARQSANDRYDHMLLVRALLAQLTEDRGCVHCAATHAEAMLALSPVQLERLAPIYLGLARRARRLNRPDLASRAASLALAADALVGDANGVAAKLAPTKQNR